MDNERGGVSEPDECASMVWELNDENVVFALLARNTKAEGLEPMTIDEAKMRPDWPRWEEVINAELKSLEDAHTWNVVERPRNTNVVSCKWVFKIKKNAAGKINKYKACLVARSFTQQYGVNYDETYVPVACLASLRLILAITSRQDWDIDVLISTARSLMGNLMTTKLSSWSYSQVLKNRAAILLPGFVLQSMDPNKAHSSGIDN